MLNPLPIAANTYQYPQYPVGGQSAAQSFINTNQTVSDSFSKVGAVTIRPNATEAHVLDAIVDSQGQILQPTLSGYQSLGQISPSGNYQLNNGLHGRLFKDPYVRLENGWERSENPFAQAMKLAERKVALANSEIPLLRQAVSNQGLTGEGIQIGILDPILSIKGQGKISDHSKLVANIIQDPVWGVAPKAQVLNVGPPIEPEQFMNSDTPLSLTNAIVQKQTGEFVKVAQQLETLSASHDPRLRVLSMTAGRTRTVAYQEAWQTLKELDESKHYKYPYTRAMVLGLALQGTEEQQLQAVVKFVDQTLDNSPVYQQTHQRYVAATQKAALSGLNIVVAMANQHGEMPCSFPLTPGAEMNEMAKSPYVIAVAASNTNETPGKRQDDKLANFSSRGDGILWNPAIAAPGQKLAVSFPVGEQAPNCVTGGTSVATPYVGGIIALMLQKNPYLTFEQIKGRLQATAVWNPQYSSSEVGAGFLNPEAALLS